MLVGISVLLMIVYAAPFLGLPELIAGSRLCSTEQLFILAVVVIPVDLAAVAIALTPGRRVLPLALAAGVAVIYVGTRQLGIFHGYLYYELTRYNAAVMVTQDITDKFPENSYTIVSTTDELYQVIEQGRHEELLTFLNRVNGSGYTLPTEYIFVYVGEAGRFNTHRAISLPDRTGWQRKNTLLTIRPISARGTASMPRRSRGSRQRRR